MNINSTKTTTGTDATTTYSECYTMLFIDRKKYEENLQRRQKEHLDGVYNRHNQNWRPCLHNSCSNCLGTGVKHDGSMCIHGISCPCLKCSTYY